MARISGKLTAKSLGWDRATVAMAVSKVPANGRVFIGRIVGIVSGIHELLNEETGEIQTGLKGNFKGISALDEYESVVNAEGVPQYDTTKTPPEPMMRNTGEKITMTAGRCYLPGGIQDMIEGVYASAIEGDGNKGATVQFGVDLYAIPSTNKAGYSYDADTVTETAEADPLDLLLASANAVKPLGLPSPEPVAEIPAVDPAKVPAKK